MLGIFQLVVVQQRLRQSPFGVQVVRIHVDGLLIGSHRVLGVLDLVVARAQREGQLGRAIILRNRLQCLDGTLEIAAFAVQPGQVQGDDLRNWDRSSALPRTPAAPAANRG